MDDTITQQLAYVKGVWKYRWAAIISAWVIATIGWFVVYELPDDYQATARIHVDTRSLLRPLMQGMTVSPDTQRKLIVTSRTLLSRPNIERVFRMVEPDSESMEPKEIRGKVSGLMKDIKLDATDTSNLFSISYNNSDRVRAISVVESLLTLFLELSDEDNENPTSALRFIDSQISNYEKKLTEQENNLKAFKQKNVGLMPSQGGDYYTQLATALEDLNKTKLALKEAEQARDSIRQQITGDEPVLFSEAEGGDGINPSSIVNLEIDARITELRKRLDTLNLNYTELHPDIISTKRLITQLQSRKIEEAKQTKFGNFDAGKNYSPMLQQLNLSLTDSQAKVAAMRARVEEYTKRYNHLKSLSNSVPEVEASLAQLNRDYRVNKKNYEQLLERRESAKISGELGSAAKLMSFKIIDPPTASDSPVGPDRERLYSIIFFVAIAAGLGIAFTISQFRPSFHSQGMLRDVTGMPVLGTIPMVQNKQEHSKRRKSLYGLSLSLLSLLGVYGVLMVKMA